MTEPAVPVDEVTADNVRFVYAMCPPIVQAAVRSILEFEMNLDGMGYDISYYQEDLPEQVKRAIAPWKGLYDRRN